MAKQKTETTKDQSKKTETQRTGSLGELKGHSVCAVLRAMGKAGWNFDRAQAALNKAGIKHSDFTVKRQLWCGKHGQGTPADIAAKELEAMAPATKPVKEPKAKAKEAKPKAKGKVEQTAGVAVADAPAAE